MNRKPQNQEPQNIEVNNTVLFLSKTSAVRHSLFGIVFRTPHPAGGSPVSIFNNQDTIVTPKWLDPKWVILTQNWFDQKWVK
jgi:hypothetical protein